MVRQGFGEARVWTAGELGRCARAHLVVVECSRLLVLLQVNVTCHVAAGRDGERRACDVSPVSLEVGVTDAGEYRRVGGHARVEDLEPFDRAARLARLVVQVGDLPHHLHRIGDDRVELLEEAERCMHETEDVA